MACQFPSNMMTRISAPASTLQHTDPCASSHPRVRCHDHVQLVAQRRVLRVRNRDLDEVGRHAEDVDRVNGHDIAVAAAAPVDCTGKG